MPTRIIPRRGGYQQLHSYQKTVVVHQITVIFCERFLSRFDRTVDQMVQAARSGKQNIVEGSMASGTSTEMEIKLTNVARASLEELLEDYVDYLRTHGAAQWDKDSPEAVFMRQQGRQLPDSRDTLLKLSRSRNSPVVANMAICLIHQANFLLDRQLKRLEQDCLRNGGLRERMYRARQGRGG